MTARWGHFMRWTALVLAGVALAFAAVGADAKGKPKRIPFNKPEILLKWINDYRHNPEPDRLAVQKARAIVIGPLQRMPKGVAKVQERALGQTVRTSVTLSITFAVSGS